MSVAYIGTIECTACGKYTYIQNTNEVTIWYHPDDDKPLCEVSCTNCKKKVSTRLTWDHVANFKKRGCKILDFGDRFPPLSDKEIDEFVNGFQTEYDKFFN